MFWTERCSKEDRIRRASLNGGDAETLGSTWKRGELHQLGALHDGVVFWAGGAVWYRAPSALENRKLADRIGGIGFHVFEGTIFWCTNAKGIERVTDLDRGTIQTISSASGTLTCLPDHRGMWRWTSAGKAMRLLYSEEGGAETELWKGWLRGPFAKCGDYVYWASDGGSIFRADRNMNVEQVNWFAANTHSSSMADSAAFDENAIYWSDDALTRILDVERDGKARTIVSGDRAWYLSANKSTICWFSLDKGNAVVKCLNRI